MLAVTVVPAQIIAPAVATQAIAPQQAAPVIVQAPTATAPAPLVNQQQCVLKTDNASARRYRVI